MTEPTPELTSVQRLFLKAHNREPLWEDLREVLLDAATTHPTLEDAAKALGIAYPTLRIWMGQVGLPTSRRRFEIGREVPA